MPSWRPPMILLALWGGSCPAQPVIAPLAVARYEDPKSPTAQDSGLKLTAGEGGGNLTLALSAPPRYCPPLCDISLSLTAPTSETAGRTQRATLDALNDAFKIGINKKWKGVIPGTGLNGVWGLVGEAERKDYSYFDETILVASTASRTPYGLSLFAGASPGDQSSRWFFLGTFKFQSAFQEGTSEVKCPLPTTGPISCVSGPIGPPVRAITRVWSFEGRYVGPLFHVGPVLSYDSVTKVKGLYVPIYFLGPEQQEKAARLRKNGGPPASSPSFNAGIDLGWRSDDRKWRVGLFVGSTIDKWLGTD